MIKKNFHRARPPNLSPLTQTQYTHLRIVIILLTGALFETKLIPRLKSPARIGTSASVGGNDAEWGDKNCQTKCEKCELMQIFANAA